MRAFCRFSHHVAYDIIVIVIAVEFLLSVSLSVYVFLARSYFLFSFPNRMSVHTYTCAQCTHCLWTVYGFSLYSLHFISFVWPVVPHSNLFCSSFKINTKNSDSNTLFFSSIASMCVSTKQLWKSMFHRPMEKFHFHSESINMENVPFHRQRTYINESTV